MNRLPNVGDLAEVIRGPGCGCLVGKTMLVTKIRSKEWTFMQCFTCGSTGLLPESVECLDDTTPENQTYITWYPRAWLRAIDPPAETQTITEREELPA